tara:strand:+ start:1179 stop:2015 length:837 start_codon:yes stop_codon:yes gene_type:complete
MANMKSIFKVMGLLAGLIEMLASTLLWQYWLPILLLPLGIGLVVAKESERRLTGKVLLILLAITIIAQPSSLDSTIEGWSLHLLISLIGPIIAMLFGIWFTLFSGPIPVAPLPRSVRPFGFALMILSAAWFAWMVFEARPAIDGVANPWWQHFVTSFLTSLVVVAGFAAAFALIMGDSRLKEASFMALISITSFLLLIYLLAEGTNSDDPVFWRSASWGALGDLGGMLFGSGLALMIFITFVWLGEKRMGVPESVEPLSEDETATIREIISTNAGVDE